MSKFDKAIKILEQRQLTLLTGLDVAPMSEMGELLSAIRVLEAAEKVDKKKAIETLRRLYHPRYNQDSNPVSVAIFDHLMILLESLPEDSK